MATYNLQEAEPKTLASVFKFKMILSPNYLSEL